jgi:hypothetical protein
MLNDLKEVFSLPIQFFQYATKQHYAAIGVGLLVALLYFRIFFRGSSGFREDVGNALKIPLADPDYDPIDKQWSHNKIMFWIFISVSSGMLAYYQLPDWFPQWFPK